MRRVLLAIEDYNELLFLETLLKKVGFDVESIRNELSLAEKMMGFSPDLVVATGEGHKINGVRVSKRVKKKGSHTKLLLLFPRRTLQKDNSLDSFLADGAVETPLNPRVIITSVCQLTGVSLESVMSKFEKLPIAQEQAASQGIQIITSKKGAAKPADPESERQKRYDEILKTSPKVPDLGFSRQLVQAEMERVRNLPEPPDAQKLEEARKEFVKALFKKS